MYRVTGEILIAQSVGLWTVIEVSSSTISIIYILCSCYIALEEYCISSVRRLSELVLYLKPISLFSKATARLLCWHGNSSQFIRRIENDKTERKGAEQRTWQLGARDCNWRYVNVSIVTFTEAPKREGCIRDLWYYTLSLQRYRGLKVTICKRLLENLR